MRPQRVDSAPVFEVEVESPATRPRPVDSSAPAHVSPARDLQTSLASRFPEEAERSTPRWPGAARLLVIGGGSALLWTAIIAGIRAVL